MRFRGRRPRTRRFMQPGSPAPPSNAPLDDPILHSPPQDVVFPPTDPSGGRKSGHSQDSTAQLPALGSADETQADSSGGLAAIPDPPDRIEFTCPCGKRLVATRELYDRRSRCAACQTVLLLNLVYRRDLGVFEIEPFSVGSDS